VEILTSHDISTH
jgi:hypothetical protein